MEAHIVKLSKQVEKIMSWIIEKDEIISHLELKCEEQHQEILKLREDAESGRSDRNVNFSIKKRVGHVVLLDSSETYELDDMDVYIDGKPRRASTVYARKKDLVSYEIDGDNNVNFLTGGQYSSQRQNQKQAKAQVEEVEREVNFSIKKRCGRVMLLDSEEAYDLEDIGVYIDEKPIKPSTVYARKKDLVSYEVDEDNQINFLTLKGFKKREEFERGMSELKENVSFVIEKRVGRVVLLDSDDMYYNLEEKEVYIDGTLTEPSTVYYSREDLISYEIDGDNNVNFLTAYNTVHQNRWKAQIENCNIM